MKARKSKLYLLFLLLLPVFSIAQTITVATDGTGDYNCDGSSDQIQINQALDYVATHADYTTVHLKGSTAFIIDQPILISSNTIFTGDTTAIIKLEDYVEWWIHNKPIITQTGRVSWDAWGDLSESISNIEIHGFEISGGIQSEPTGDTYYAMFHFTNPNNV